MIFMTKKTVAGGGGGNPAVTFDGSDWLTRGGGLTGAADTAVGVSGYIEGLNTTNTGTMYVMNTDGLQFEIWIGGGNGKLRIEVNNTSGAKIADFRTNVAIRDGVSHDIHWSFDAAAPAYQMYLDGADALETVAGATAGTVDMTHTDWAISSQTAAGFNQYNGDMARFTIWQGVVLDVSNATVRANMADTAQAASLGTNIIDFYGAASVWNAGTNQGSGGNFTMNGAVT